MNTPNPLVPQGTTPPGGKVSFPIAVFSILVVHVVLFGGLLIGGCSKDAKTPVPEEAAAPVETNAYAMATNDPYMPPMDNTNALVTDPSNSISSYEAPSAIATSAPAAVTSFTPPETTSTAAGTEYTVVKGDMLSTIAKTNGVTLKALLAANPGVDPKKLVPGKTKLQIPAPTAAVASTTGSEASASTASAPDAASSKPVYYTVKANDTLGKIATSHKTTVAAIVSLNKLKSKDSIKLGQKLKMPAPKA